MTQSTSAKLASSTRLPAEGPARRRRWETPVVVAESLADKTNSKNGFVSETHIGCVANCVGPTS